jgi:hypothetical protein
MQKINEEQAMSIEKKSLISNRSASKKAIVTKPEVSKVENTKVGSLHNKVGSLHNRVGSAHSKIGGLGNKIGGLGNKIGGLNSRVKTF